MNEFYADEDDDWAQAAPVVTGKCRECGTATLRGMPICKECYTKDDIDEGARAQDLACLVSDAIWGGELGWTNATSDQFKSLLKEARARLYRKAKT